MADYISREAAAKLLTSIALEVPDSKSRTVAKCINKIELMPAANVEPVRRGWWKKFDSSYCRMSQSGYQMIDCVKIRCGLCGRGSAVRTNYCPNCGAKMDLEDENDN